LRGFLAGKSQVADEGLGRYVSMVADIGHSGMAVDGLTCFGRWRLVKRW